MKRPGGPLTIDQADEIYSILVKHAGASETDRGNFLHHQTLSYCPEYRFMGALGFGGKFWRDFGNRSDGTWGEIWYVDCYTEDLNDGIFAMMLGANHALTGLRESYEN